MYGIKSYPTLDARKNDPFNIILARKRLQPFEKYRMMSDNEIRS
jgi:hypothetical protein